MSSETPLGGEVYDSHSNPSKSSMLAVPDAPDAAQVKSTQTPRNATLCIMGLESILPLHDEVMVRKK